MLPLCFCLPLMLLPPSPGAPSALMSCICVHKYKPRLYIWETAYEEQHLSESGLLFCVVVCGACLLKKKDKALKKEASFSSLWKCVKSPLTKASSPLGSDAALSAQRMPSLLLIIASQSSTPALPGTCDPQH